MNRCIAGIQEFLYTTVSERGGNGWRMVERILFLRAGMKKITLLLLWILLHVLPTAWAQTADLGSWNILNLKYQHSQRLSLFGEAQLRSLKFYRHFHYYEFKGGVNVKIHPAATFTLAAGTYQTYKEGGNFVLPKNNNEFRLWPQLLLTQKIHRLNIEQRYRMEMRWTSNGYRNRFRYRLGAAYPLGKEKSGYRPFQASLSNELFFTDREPYFERNRIQVGMTIRLSPHNSVLVGYLHQFDYKINDETGRDFLVIGYFVEL